MEDQRLLGPRAGEKIRDMLVKQKPGMAIRQIQERSGLNHNNPTEPCSHLYSFALLVLLFVVYVTIHCWLSNVVLFVTSPAWVPRVRYSYDSCLALVMRID